MRNKSNLLAKKLTLKLLINVILFMVTVKIRVKKQEFPFEKRIYYVLIVDITVHEKVIPI